GMKRLRNGKINFLFFYGQDDQLATADSVRLAHEVLTPNDHHNLIGVKGTGHNDLVVGLNSKTEVWGKTLDWLKEMSPIA
ncbi:MAG: hypothetical protein WC624_06175, partial [Candidatus Margulisiibacteriota bacterium]